MDMRYQIVQSNWLLNEAILFSREDPTGRIFIYLKSRKETDPCTTVILPYLLGQFKATHLWHSDVQNNGVIVMGPEIRQCMEWVSERIDIESLRLQSPRYRIQDVFIVVGEKYSMVRGRLFDI